MTSLPTTWYNETLLYLQKEKPGLPRFEHSLPQLRRPGKRVRDKRNNVAGCAEKLCGAGIVQNDGEAARFSLHPVENL